MKKWIYLLTTALLLCLLTACEPSEEQALTYLKINPYGGGEQDVETILWDPAGEDLNLYLPAGTDPQTARVFLDGAGVSLDGKPLRSGDSAAAFTPGEHSLVWGEHSLKLTVYRSASLPAVFLQTESGSLEAIHADKSHKEGGTLRVYERELLTLDQPLNYIKGRGNATWTYPKRPYNIKFDTKIDLFGLGEAKKWTLLANYIDQSLLRNARAWEYAAALDVPSSSGYQHIDLYINGSYLGTYQVCESVEVGKNRVNIPDLDKANEEANPGLELKTLPGGNTSLDSSGLTLRRKAFRKWIELPRDPADISGGYLLEFDYWPRYNEERCGFVTSLGQPVELKAPELASRQEVNYIADLLDAATEALYDPSGYNSEGRHYSEYFDMDSLVSTYILQELSMNYDAGLSSFYIYKAQGDGKLIFGPVWDMDNSFGSPFSHMGVPMDSPGLWWANNLGCNGIPTLLTAAYRHEAFRALVRDKWAALRKAEVFEAVERRIETLTEALSASGEMNDLRWGYQEPSKLNEAGLGFSESAAEGQRFISERIEALDLGFSPEGAYLYYNYGSFPGGEWSSASPILRVGETATVRDITENVVSGPGAEQRFVEWNTLPDGSGESYQPGDPLLLEGGCTVLYAIWEISEGS